jgi:hypothetical protein
MSSEEYSEVLSLNLSPVIGSANSVLLGFLPSLQEIWR